MVDGVLGQFLRYGLIGLTANAIGYGLYLSMTHFGVGYKISMSLLYFMGLLQTFVFNKRWTFRHHGDIARTFWKYFLLYAGGYALNLCAMIVLVDQMALMHQWVMLGLMLLMPLVFFGGQKYWVFRTETKSQ